LQKFIKNLTKSKVSQGFPGRADIGSTLTKCKAKSALEKQLEKTSKKEL